MNGSDASGILSLLSCLFFLGVAVAIIVGLVFATRNANEVSKQSEMAINQLMANIPSDKQGLFMMQYSNARKNPTTAVLLALFLGGLGAHKFYMGQVGLGILYLLFCWTYIPSIIAFIELFTLSGQVGKYNQQKAAELVMMLGGQMPLQMGYQPH